MQENQKVGLWTLISPTSDGQRWKCKCECGTIRSVLTYNLDQKKTKSCGCARAALKNAMSVPVPSMWAAHNARRKEAANVLI